MQVLDLGTNNDEAILGFTGTVHEYVCTNPIFTRVDRRITAPVRKDRHFSNACKARIIARTHHFL